MAKELTPEEWLTQIDMGLEFRRRRGLEESWAMLEALFYNVDPSQELPGPNIIMSQGDTILSSLSVPYPMINVSPMTSKGIEGARVVERVDNNLIYDLELSKEFEEATLNAYLYGVGVLKVGYDSEFGFRPEDQIQIGEESLDMTLSGFSNKGERIEYDSRIRPGMPWVKTIPTSDIVVPYGTRRFEDAPWVAQRFVRTLTDLKADPKYKVPRDLRPNMSGKDFVNSYSSVMKRMVLSPSPGQSSIAKELQNGEFVECWEIHDQKRKKIYVVTGSSDKFLRKDVDHLQMYGLPYVSLSFTPRSKWFWVTPESFYLLSSQNELLDIYLQAQKQRRISVLHFLIKSGAMSVEEAEKLVSPDVGATAWIDGDEVGDDVRKAITPFTATNNNINLYQIDAEAIRRDARETLGGGRNAAGQFEKGRKTATETLAVQQGGNLRMNRRMGNVAHAYENIFRKVNAIIGRFWTRRRMVEVGDEYVPFNGQVFRGGYRYKIGFSVAPQPSAQQARAEAMQTYLTLSQDPKVDQGALVEYLTSEFNDPMLDRVFSGGESKDADLRARMSAMSQTG